MAGVTMGPGGLTGSRLILGCMGLGGGWNDNPVGDGETAQARSLLETALELGINTIDHADIYTFGKAEETFGRVLAERPGLRDQLVLQSKCGIRIGGRDGVGTSHYDLSAGWIRSSVEGILRRLRTDRLDLLLLHRPDPLMEPEEISTVLHELKSAGKVLHFGVSNMNVAALRLLQPAVPGGIQVNQLEASLLHRDFVEAGVTFNHGSRPQAPWFDEGTLEECRLNGIRLQAWSPLAGGVLTADFSNGQMPQAAHDVIRDLSQQWQVSREAVALAWLLRHPAGFQPVLGTTKPDRLRACAQALKLNFDRENWNRLLTAARGQTLP